MGKQYLNREEKNQALTLAAFIRYLDEKAAEWAKAGRAKDAVKYLRMAKSFVGKSLDSLFEGLAQEERNRLVPELRKIYVAVKYKDAALREYNRMLALDSVIPIKTDDLLEICSQALAICYSCKKADPAACKLRKLYITYDIPVYDEDPPAGRCPYKV
jgi:tetratricopeptide (TPR) repeat protein